MNKFKKVLLVATTLSILCSCGGEESSISSVLSNPVDSSEAIESSLVITDPVTGIDMVEGYESIGVGETYSLNAKVLPETATDQTIIYTSSDENVATVDGSGVVTGVGHGSVTITAKTQNNGFEKSFELDVIDYDGKLVAGSINGIASKSFYKVDNGIYRIERFDENDVAYMKLDVSDSDYYFEATIKQLQSNVTIEDINATEGFTSPTGLGGVTAKSVYSFGPTSYQKKTFDKVYYDKNYYDATLTLNDAAAGLTPGAYTEYSADLGGEGSYFIIFNKGFKVGLLRKDNVYYYFVNDIYIGANAAYVEELGQACPALTSFKSGAYYTNLKYYPGTRCNFMKEKLDAAIAKNLNSTMFKNPYAEIKTNESTKTTTDYVIDLDGEVYLSNNIGQTVLPTNYRGTHFYFEFTYNLSGHSKYTTEGEDYTWAGGAIGVTENDDCRFQALGMTNNPRCPTATTNVIQYTTNEGYWREVNLLVDRYRGLEGVGDYNYKVAVMRQGTLFQYFINDVLVYKDVTPYVYERKDGTCSPAVINYWGGSSKLEGLTLLTDPTEIEAKFIEIDPWEKPMELPSKVKVILLSGQSNCEGVTRTKDLTQEQLEEYSIDYNNVAIDYYSYSTMNSSDHQFVNVGFGQGLDRCYFGYEIGMAYEIQKNDPNNFYVFIKWARGDSDIYANWRSPSTGKTTGYLYEGFKKSVNESLANLTAAGVEYEIAGMCWMQGERDGCYAHMAQSYEENLRYFYQDMCALFDEHAEGGKLKFFDATIKDYGNTYLYWEQINAAKYQLQTEYKDYYHVIETNAKGPTNIPGLNLTTLTYDWNHYDPDSELKLGRAFGSEVLKYTNK